MTILRDDLEAAAAHSALGSGWISGVLALVLALAGLGAVLCLHYPEVLTVADARQYYNLGIVRLALHLGLVAAFLLGIVSIVLRKQKVLGFSALAVVLVATVLGGSRAQDQIDVPRHSTWASTGSCSTCCSPASCSSLSSDYWGAAIRRSFATSGARTCCTF